MSGIKLILMKRAGFQDKVPPEPMEYYMYYNTFQPGARESAHLMKKTKMVWFRVQFSENIVFP